MNLIGATNSHKTGVCITYNSNTEVIWSRSYIFIAITDCQVRYVALWSQLLRHLKSVEWKHQIMTIIEQNFINDSKTKSTKHILHSPRWSNTTIVWLGSSRHHTSCPRQLRKQSPVSADQNFTSRSSEPVITYCPVPSNTAIPQVKEYKSVWHFPIDWSQPSITSTKHHSIVINKVFTHKLLLQSKCFLCQD